VTVCQASVQLLAHLPIELDRLLRTPIARHHRRHVMRGAVPRDHQQRLLGLRRRHPRQRPQLRVTQRENCGDFVRTQGFDTR
jgi:hypothetical protein